MKVLNPLRRMISQGSVWPAIDAELIHAQQAGYLRGKILNAGAGWRDVSHLVDGELVNQDLTWPEDTRTNIHIRSPLDTIPTPDATFDTVLCIAVLEHVEDPEAVVREFRRVLRPGGHVVASVPFLQPEHKVPTDFQRYTRDGLVRLFASNGFDVVDTRGLFTVYHTLHWIVYEWLHLQNTLTFRSLRVLLLPPLLYLARHSDLTSDKLATAFQVVARKP